MLLFTKELEEQRYGRNKQTTVNHTYINGGEFRRKFDNISNNRNLNRRLYQLAKKMLNHRSGTLYEDMYWINVDTADVVASELESDVEEQILYSDSTIETIRSYDNLLTIHSHPNSFPPSISDLNSNYINGYQIGIIVCHDGKIYMYSVLEEINENYYHMTIAEYLNQGYTESDAQLMTLQHLQERFDIQFKEVTGDDV